MTVRLRRTLLSAALLAAALPAAAQSVQATPFSKTVFFGDSLTDAGFFRPLLPAASQSVTGQFTTNPGWVWSQYLADYYGSNANVAWKATGATPARADGNNWAVGGARVTVDTVGGFGYTPSLASQYKAYLAAGNNVDPNALYALWGGANDLFQATGVYQATLAGGGTAAQAQAAAQAIVGSAVTSQVGLVGTLTQAGARYILVPNVPDLGMTPSYRAQGASAQALGTAFSSSYNSALYGGLAQAGLRVIPVDAYNFLREVVASPSTYGMTNVTGQACLPQPAPAGDSSLFCNPLSTVPGGANSWLFADGVHPTTGAQKAIADLAVSMIDGPRTIAVLPHSAATIGRARAQMVDAAVAGMASTDGDGMRWWADVRGDQQRFNSSAGFDGLGATGTFGLGWRSGNLAYGAFAGYGRQKVDFGFRRGDFRQNDATLGGFLAWRGDGAWANGQLSWTRLDYKVNREVNLGPAQRIHHGSPKGSNLSASAGAGWTFRSGALEHGPLLSVLMQDIRVDGYAEDSTMSSALAFPRQNADSLMVSAGWQGSYAINEHLKPYARLAYNRETKDAPAQAFAQSLSMPGTLPYAVPGLAFEKTYGSATFGLMSRFGGMDVVTGSTLSINQKGGHDSSFFITVGGAF